MQSVAYHQYYILSKYNIIDTYQQLNGLPQLHDCNAVMLRILLGQSIENGLQPDFFINLQAELFG